MQARRLIIIIALIYTSVAQGQRTLPDNWITHNSRWDTSPSYLHLGYGYSTPEAGYYRSRSILFRTEDGERWEVVDTPEESDQDIGRTRSFRILDFTTVESFDFFEAPRGVYYSPLPNAEYQRAVRFDGAWWTHSLRSVDGMHWELTEFGNFLQSYDPRNDWNPPPYEPQINSSNVYTDGNSILLQIQSTITFPPPILQSWSLTRNLIRDKAGTIRTYTDSSGSVVFINGSPKLFQYDEITGNYPARCIAPLGEQRVLISDGSASVAVRDATQAHPYMIYPIPIEGLEDVAQLHYNGTVAVAMDYNGQIAFSEDLQTWKSGAQLPPFGHLGVEDGEFIYAFSDSYYHSPNGESWVREAPEMPSETAQFEPRLNANLAYQDSDGNGFPDRVWRRLKEGGWQLLGEGYDFDQLNYFPKVEVAFMRMIWTEEHPGIFPETDTWTMIWASHETRILKDLRYWNGAFYYAAESQSRNPDYDPSLMIWAGGFFFASGYNRIHIIDDAFRNVQTLPYSFSQPTFIPSGDRLLVTNSRDHYLYLSQPFPQYPFEDGIIRPDGWRASEWFGWVHTKHYPWVYQYPAGWIFVQVPDKSNCWMWDTTEGWFWSSQFYWPVIWTPERGWKTHANITEWQW